MEKPDKNGFVNVLWPSKTIPHGGIFHAQVVQPSEDSRKLLKLLLEESKLSIAQRAKNTWKLRQNNEERERPQRASRDHVSMVRPRTSKRRSLSAIRESGIYEPDGYQPPKRGEDREQLKEKFAKLMAYGDSPEQQKPVTLPSGLYKHKIMLPTAKEIKNDLLTQIRERVDWLAEMEELGQAAPHRDIIQDQIAKRLRELDALGSESECNSVRSNVTGSREYIQPMFRDQHSIRLKGSAGPSVHSKNSIRSQEKSKPKVSSAAKQNKREENVYAYNNAQYLMKSPRRRV